ncbi:MAG: hypothetical protein LBQ95_05145 [Lachnospiraceae bacterium]|nr:hypothetical protein [Lachnospiraceae bacterium]
MNYPKKLKMFFQGLLSNNAKTQLWLFIIVFILNLIFIIPVKYVYNSDEYGVFATAAFLSGKYDWSSAITSSVPIYFGYGLALFYVPLFYIFTDMYRLYKFALAINAVFIALIPVFAHKISAIVLKSSYDDFRTRLVAVLTSLVVGITPAYTLLSKFTFTEAMCAFIPWVALFVLLKIITAKENLKRILYSILLGFLGVFGYATHNRLLSVLIVLCMIVLVFSIIKRRILGILIPFAASVVLFYFIDNLIKNYLYISLYRTDADSITNTLQSNFGDLGLDFINLPNIVGLIKGFWGQVFYLVFSTWGMLVLGIILLIGMLYTMRKHHPVSGELLTIGLFTFSCVLLALAVSVISFRNYYITGDAKRYDVFMYGRYVESLAVMAVFFVFLYSLKQANVKVKKMIFPICCFLFLYGGAFIVLHRFEHIKNTAYSMFHQITAVLPFVTRSFTGSPKTRDFLLILMFGSLFIALVYNLIRKNHLVLASIVIIVISLYSQGFTLKNYVYPAGKRYSDWIEFTQYLAANIDASQIEKIYVDRTARENVFDAQFAFPNTEVVYLNTFTNYNEIKNLPKNSLIIGSNCEFIGSFGDIYTIETDFDYCAMVYGKALADNFRENGLTVNETPGYEIVDSTDLTLFGNAVLKSSRVYLFEESNATTPLLYLYPGSYSIEIYGSDLDNIEFFLTYNNSERSLEFSKIGNNYNNRLTLNIDSKVFINDFKIKLETANSDTTPAIIDYILIKRTTPLSSKDTANDFSAAYRDMTYGAFMTSSAFSFDGELIYGSTGVFMYAGATANLSHVEVINGTYELTVNGTNLENADVIITDEHTGKTIPLSITRIENDSAIIVFDYKGNASYISLDLSCKGKELFFKGFTLVYCE